MSNVATAIGAGGRTLKHCLCLAVFFVAAGGAYAAGPVYSDVTHHPLTLTITEETTVSHTLDGAPGLSDGDMPQGTLLATGSFSGSAHVYGFRWENRNAACGASMACSRVMSTDNSGNYIDMTAVFPAPANVTTNPGLPDYTVVDLGTGTSGTYTLRHMTGEVVKVGTYRVQTSIGVYTP